MPSKGRPRVVRVARNNPRPRHRLGRPAGKRLSRGGPWGRGRRLTTGQQSAVATGQAGSPGAALGRLVGWAEGGGRGPFPPLSAQHGVR